MDSFLTSNGAKLEVAPADVRVILWDIDGTLMTSTVGGAYKEYLGPVLEDVYGTSGRLGEMSVSGMTDTQIAYEAIKDEGISVGDVFAKLDQFSARLEKGMRDFIANRHDRYRKFDGASEILAETQRTPKFINSLLTGNLAIAAKIKLEYVNLWSFFENVPGAFGEISHDRQQLAFEAGIIYKKYLSTELKPSQFIIVGDTPNDIDCARAFGANVISVATGRNHPPEELEKHSPDFLLENLENTEELFRILKSF
jgi:phosphoglycolate phosphatase-like HAD superfamily hydrolase